MEMLSLREPEIEVGRSGRGNWEAWRVEGEYPQLPPTLAEIMAPVPMEGGDGIGPVDYGEADIEEADIGDTVMEGFEGEEDMGGLEGHGSMNLVDMGLQAEEEDEWLNVKEEKGLSLGMEDLGVDATGVADIWQIQRMLNQVFRAQVNKDESQNVFPFEKVMEEEGEDDGDDGDARGRRWGGVVRKVEREGGAKIVKCKNTQKVKERRVIATLEGMLREEIRQGKWGL